MKQSQPALTVKRGDEIHVYPSNRGHVLTLECWCWPYRDRQDPFVVIHRKNEA